jgi:hypothetical protein
MGRVLKFLAAHNMRSEPKTTQRCFEWFFGLGLQNWVGKRRLNMDFQNVFEKFYLLTKMDKNRIYISY